MLLTSVHRLHDNCVKQWEILERRLSVPDQQYIALPDRPSIADLSYFPLAMPWMFEFLGVDISKFPFIDSWGKRLMDMPAVRSVVERGPTYGHTVG